MRGGCGTRSDRAPVSAEPTVAEGEPTAAGTDRQPLPGEPGAPLPPGLGRFENGAGVRVYGECPQPPTGQSPAVPILQVAVGRSGAAGSGWVLSRRCVR